MEIKPRVIRDSVSGLQIAFIEGERQNHIHIEIGDERIVNNRDFWFRKDGTLDGTGSCVACEVPPDAQPKGTDA